MVVVAMYKSIRCTWQMMMMLMMTNGGPQPFSNWKAGRASMAYQREWEKQQLVLIYVKVRLYICSGRLEPRIHYIITNKPALLYSMANSLLSHTETYLRRWRGVGPKSTCVASMLNLYTWLCNAERGGEIRTGSGQSLNIDCSGASSHTQAKATFRKQRPHRHNCQRHYTTLN